MSSTTTIEWTEATWNPVTGCRKVSEGCDNCYAETFAERWRGIPGHPFEQGFDVRLWPDRLTLPLRWRKARVVFVNSMSDLWIDEVDHLYAARVFAVMALAGRHTFQLLTKRPGRMASVVSSQGFRRAVDDEVSRLVADGAVEPIGSMRWPLPNVWLGVSVETQRWAEIRLPKLVETPAAVRFASCEPLLGPLDLSVWLGQGLDWVIVGGESGPRFRPMDRDWVRSLRDQCQAAGVAFFFKQVGGRTPKAGGRELDGRTWDQMPDLAGGVS
jgi:protein gp37